MKMCSADPACPRPAYRSGICHSHETIVRLGLPMAESVWIAKRLANVKRVGECIIWQGRPNNVGYGKVSVQNDPSAAGREEAVHRWFYKRFRGPLAADEVLDHLCRTPLCVNVDHLEPVTLAENTRRGFEARGYGSTRTHCAHGHPWVAENLTIEPGKRPGLTSRRCRICKKQQDAARHRRNRLARAGELAADGLAVITNLGDPRGTPHIYTLPEEK